MKYYVPKNLGRDVLCSRSTRQGSTKEEQGYADLVKCAYLRKPTTCVSLQLKRHVHGITDVRRAMYVDSLLFAWLSEMILISHI